MEAGGSQEPAASARKRAGGHSGRLLLRMPESLHAELARVSQREGVSLNGYITDVLAAAVRGDSRPRPASRAEGAAAEPERRTLLQRLLLVNVAVVALVGVLVVVLLVQALR
jgi:hypothetical protein